MLGLLASIGIEKDKPFNPTSEQARVCERAVHEAPRLPNCSRRANASVMPSSVTVTGCANSTLIGTEFEARRGECDGEAESRGDESRARLAAGFCLACA